jgi:hypothetical protein
MTVPYVAGRTEEALWPLLLVAVSAVASWGFACVTPFPALAVAAAYVLRGRAAFLAVGGIWLANQLVGYAALDYPWTPNTALWGLAIAVAALLAAGAAMHVLGRHERSAIRALVVALPVAFCLYEAVLIVATPALGGIDGFAPHILGGFALLNLAWAAALVGVAEAVRGAAALTGGSRAWHSSPSR